MGSRNQYKIREFAQARAALDDYYLALEALALEYRMLRFHPQKNLDEAATTVRLARERLGRAITGLGFTLAAEEAAAGEAKEETTTRGGAHC